DGFITSFCLCTTPAFFCFLLILSLVPLRSTLFPYTTLFRSDFEALPGYGIYAKINDQEVYVGTRKLMAEQNVTITNETEAMMEELEQDGKTAMLISVANKLAGIIAVADTVKETSKEAIS